MYHCLEVLPKEERLWISRI